VVAEVSSTPHDQSEAVVEASVCGLAGIEPGAIDAVFHDTTVATNMAIDLVGAEVGTITTRGFRDILHMARHRRPRNFSLQFDVPWQAKSLMAAIIARRPAKSPFRSPWTKSGGRRAFAKRGMAVIVAFLFSFLNNDARAARKEIVMSVLPNMSVSQRGPKTPAYLRSLAGRLRANGINAMVRIMQSNGGISTIENSSELRIGLLLSGSAGGVIGGRWTGENWGKRNIITIRYPASGFMTHESDRNEDAPWGIFGGKSGHGSKLELRNTVTREVSYQPAKFSGLRTNIGDTITCYLPVGGGFGAPLDRDPRKVPDDVLDGFITVDHARDDYGVVLDDYGMALSEVDDG
jgi:Hydantoinase/oxoprolinase N-terminal region/Hydantoinase B/oxoprolinase/Hydantoinase/oxoprolinase